MINLHVSSKNAWGLIFLIGLIVFPLCIDLSAQSLVSSVHFDEPFSDWKPADLRLLRSSQFDQGHPEIIAVYSRIDDHDLSIRIDFTENISFEQYDVELVIVPSQISTTSGDPCIANSSTCAFTLTIFGLDKLSVSNKEGIWDDKQIAFYQDKTLKSIVLSLPSPPSEFTSALSRANVNLVDSRLSTRVASTDWFPIKSTKITPRAPVVLAFITALKTGTPAELLRSWNGAHTGPLGQRHGLEQVFSAVEQYQVPVFLLDLTTPERLSALSMIGQLGRLENLNRKNLVYLADTSPGDPASWQKVQQVNQTLTEEIWPHKSRIAYLPFNAGIPGQYELVFGNLPEKGTIRVWDKRNVIPLPDENSMIKSSEGDMLWQVDHKGLSFTAEAILLKTALSPDNSDLVVLGGRLPDSTWADSAVIPQAFYRIANTPWIRVLTETDLVTWQGKPFSSDTQIQCENILCWKKLVTLSGSQNNHLQLIDRLNKVPENPIGLLAWSTYARLTQPELDETTYTLNLSYLDQVDRLITAAYWAEKPEKIETCDSGLYGSDCILADEQQLLFLNQNDGSLITGFIILQGTVEQWTAPYSQRATALSDPSEWHEIKERLFDPAVINGSFIPSAAPTPYSWAFGDNKLRFLNPATGYSIAYTITQNSLTVEQNNTNQSEWALILAPCPLIPYQPAAIHSMDVNQLSPAVASLTMPGCLKIETSTSGIEVSSISSYLDSPAYDSAFEDPNKDYPAGHYLPAGYVSIDYRIDQSGTITFKFSK